MKTIYFPSFGTKLGFANTAFQYLFISHISRLFEIKIKLGTLDKNTLPNAAIIPVQLFGIKNYGSKVISENHIELSTDRMNGLEHDITEIAAFINDSATSTLEISGYFQYHTSIMAKSGLNETFNHIFLGNSEEIPKNNFQKTLINNQKILLQIFKQKTLIVCHIRLGDYKIYEKYNIDFTYTVDIKNLLKTIKEFIKFNYIRNAEIYLASDDIDECMPYFLSEGITPITARSFFPSDMENSGTNLMLDLSAISIADVFFASNSSFSIFGSLLNQKKSIFFRPSPENKDMIGFLPWNTQILFKKSNHYPCSL